jgi:hypothetical protein
MFIQDPDFYPSRIPDPKTASKEGRKKNCCHTLYVASNFTKLKIILFLKCWRKKLGQFSKNYRTFYPKNCHSLKYWFGIRDPRSGIWKKSILDPGSRGQKGTRSRIRNTGLTTKEKPIIVREKALPVPEVSSQLWKIQNVLIFPDSPIIVGCWGLRRHFK